MKDTGILTEGLKDLGISLSSGQMEKLIAYYDLLTEKNKVMNLTAVTEFEDVCIKHYLDSLSLIKAFDPENAETLIDVGTGAGFPGVVLKIAWPHLRVTLMDSLNKRISFLNDVIGALDLKDIRAVHSRAEDLGRDKEYREVYDLAVSRAVADLSVLSEYCIPFVRKAGCFVAYKTQDAGEEILGAKKAINVLGGEDPEIISFNLPGTEFKRALVRINKIKDTPKKYPRKAGTPGKEPIK